MAFVSRLEWCAGKKELGEEEEEVGGFRWEGEWFWFQMGRRVVLPDPLSWDEGVSERRGDDRQI